MPTHESFLAAIAAEPHERDARLVYADWLEDQGDARAELIRVMEEMHALAPYSDRFWELRPRRAQLKQGVADDWLIALGYNVYRPLFTKMPAEREHRWRLITEFIETWHGPLGDSPGNSEEEGDHGLRDSLGIQIAKSDAREICAVWQLHYGWAFLQQLVSLEPSQVRE
jgi:uncharacterized protein (TIGR02996 family)